MKSIASPSAQFQEKYKKIEIYSIPNVASNQLLQRIHNHIRILFLEKGNTITIDFKTYTLSADALFFVNVNQYIGLETTTGEQNKLIAYNRDFYCIQIHDKEVACDGLLFNNILQLPMIHLTAEESIMVKKLIMEMEDEMNLADSSTEEMLRICLKKLIIVSTRIWKKQNLEDTIPSDSSTEIEFFRNFSRLIEIHFRSKHAVSDYAELLDITPKSLTTKFKKIKLDNPNEYIKDRIMLEAKRLLVHTSLSVKEIAYRLGYEEPPYFNRIFTQKVGKSPLNYRNENGS